MPIPQSVKKVHFGSPCQGSCLRGRLRGSHKRLYYSIFSPSGTALPGHLPRQREAKYGLSTISGIGENVYSFNF